MVEPSNHPALSQEDLDRYQRLFQSEFIDLPGVSSFYQDLIQKGALLHLANSGTADAVRLIGSAVVSCANPEVPSLAVAILDHLASQGNQEAQINLCALVVAHNQPAARQAVLAGQYQFPSDQDNVLLFLLTGQIEKYLKLDPAQALLTSAFQKANASLHSRILVGSRQAGLEEWALVMTAIQSSDPEGLLRLATRFGAFKNENARQLTLHQLESLASQGDSGARNALCQIVINHGDPGAVRIALEAGFTPDDPIQRALFYLLTGQWHKYEQYDFNHSLLAIAYENADRALRQRIIAQTRRVGHLEWAQGISSGRRLRWLADMTDQDWDLAISALQRAEKWTDLWRLIQVAPSVWSAPAILALYQSGWNPGEADREGFTLLGNLASTAAQRPPEVHCRKDLTGHLLDITCLAVDLPHNLLATGSSDLSVRFWDLVTGQLRRLLPLPGGGRVWSLAFSPDGETLAAGYGEHAIQLFRVSDWKEFKTLEGHTGTVKSLAVAPGNRLLVSGSFDRTVRLWRFPYGPELKVLNQHNGEIFSVTFSPDGHWVASAGADRTICLWALPDGRLINCLEGHSDTITTLSISPDQLLLASGGRDRSIRLWSFPDGYLQQDPEILSAAVSTTCFHPNGKFLACGCLDGAISILSASTGRRLAAFSAHRGAVTGLAMNNTGDTLVSCGIDRAIRLWDLRTLVLTRQPVDTLENNLIWRALAASQDDQTSPENQAWIDYFQAQVRWKQRLDIGLDEPQVIQAGEFDIEIAG